MLGDKVIVTTTTGPGKVEEHVIEAGSAGGYTRIEMDGNRLISVVEYTRKGDARQTLVVNPDAMVVIREVKRRR